MTVPGRTLAGRYDILERVGAGGMGEVYRARDRELDELVALKVIRADVTDPDAIARFRNEVKLARRVTHANVARTFELGSAEGVMYCTMELVNGESLLDRLARERKLLPAQAVAIACALCDALAAAHAAGVIHRDIKPANVLIANDGRVVLTDFGIAAANAAGAAADDDANTAGTPAYMAPEQARGEPPTPAADVYAVGVLLYEMLTGQLGFAGPVVKVATDKQELERLVIEDATIPGELANVVGRATTRRPEDRVPTAAGLRRALAPWAPTDGTATGPPVPAVPAPEERVVIVLAPRGDDDRLYIVEALHEELLNALSRSPGVRVLPRAERRARDGERGLVVRFELAGDALAVIAESAAAAASLPPTTLHVPLATRTIPHAVALAVRMVEGLFAPAPARSEAYDLLAQARHIARRRALVDGPRAILEHAHGLAPDDPQISAATAIWLVRAAFFARELDTTLIPRATEFVRVALETGQHLVETHLAAAHLELHTGEAAVAAAHYRAAIACAPYSAEAHDFLGRLLLEAGYLDAGFARLAQAAAIAPLFVDVPWQIARALALEGRWKDVDRIVNDQTAGQRSLALARFARWRGDPEMLERVRASFAVATLDPQLAELMFSSFLDGAWYDRRDELRAVMLNELSPSRRRNAFLAQLVAEAAGVAGDVESCLEALARSVAHGLFDRHWMEKCPTLDCARATAAFEQLRVDVAARAHAVYDALYGDHPSAHGETVPATR